ncbi:MAG: hypothetical protein V3U52_01230 [Thermoplasmata archaeon]
MTGERGSGKTLSAMAFALYLMTFHGYHVLSNILLKKCVGIDEEGHRQFKKASWPNYHFTRSFSDLMWTVGKLLKREGLHKARLLWIADEAGGPGGFSAYDSVFSAQSKDLISLATLARKFRLSTLMLAQTDKLLHSRVREVGAGFVSALVRKDYNLVRRKAWPLLSQYDIRAICIFEFPEHDFASTVVTIPNIDLPLIKPAEKAEVGDVVYDTYSPANFSVGRMVGSGKPFVLKRLLDYISGVISEDVPDRIIEFFQRSGNVEIESDFDLSLEQAAKEAVKGTQRYARETVLPVLMDEIRPLIEQGITSKLTLAKTVQSILKEKHGIEMSVDRLRRKSYIGEAVKRLKADRSGLIEEVAETL